QGGSVPGERIAQRRPCKYRLCGCRQVNPTVALLGALQEAGQKQAPHRRSLKTGFRPHSSSVFLSHPPKTPANDDLRRSNRLNIAFQITTASLCPRTLSTDSSSGNHELFSPIAL